MSANHFLMRRHEHKEMSHSIRALWVAIIATASILLLEFAGGLWTNSLALLSDSAHVFMDLLSFGISLSAILIAQRPVSETRTFGWHRIEVFAALINGFTVFLIAILILIQGVRRLAHPQPILGPEMLGIALLGLAINLFVIWKLHPFAQKDLNVHSAFLHALGDAAASLAVVLSGLVVLYSGNPLADPIAAIVVSLIILIGAYRIFRDSVHILLEGVPKGLDRKVIVQAIEDISGPSSVRDLHIWNLCSHLCALSVHLSIPEAQMPQQKAILEKIHHSLEKKFDILHTTIQIESETWH